MEPFLQPAELRMFQQDPDQSDCVQGYTAYQVRIPGGVYAGRNYIELVGLRRGRLYFVIEGGGTIDQSLFDGQLSRVFVRDGSPINPAVFSLVLPNISHVPPVEPRSAKGTWGVQAGTSWIENQLLPRRLLPEEYALYTKFAARLTPRDASAFAGQSALSQIVFENHYRTDFVVNREATGLLDHASECLSGSYLDSDSIRVELTILLAARVLRTAQRRRVDNCDLDYVIPSPDQLSF